MILIGLYERIFYLLFVCFQVAAEIQRPENFRDLVGPYVATHDTGCVYFMHRQL